MSDNTHSCAASYQFSLLNGFAIGVETYAADFDHPRRLYVYAISRMCHAHVAVGEQQIVACLDAHRSPRRDIAGYGGLIASLDVHRIAAYDTRGPDHTGDVRVDANESDISIVVLDPA
ncbi:MAG: hypothetical protein AW11_01360 [Candidatus Accumulibacter regalis]|uniref:Uncharacterized protein n=1 Tax=Accumulibacter regalis TaxID=522306 RepID=A0A011QJW8_ACCRE|nr:MAG: hypothetical protein AW11_01360 [Candidatus Accumulibacter regalis]